MMHSSLSLSLSSSVCCVGITLRQTLSCGKITSHWPDLGRSPFPDLWPEGGLL